MIIVTACLLWYNCIPPSLIPDCQHWFTIVMLAPWASWRCRKKISIFLVKMLSWHPKKLDSLIGWMLQMLRWNRNNFYSSITWCLWRNADVSIIVDINDRTTTEGGIVIFVHVLPTGTITDVLYTVGMSSVRWATLGSNRWACTTWDSEQSSHFITYLSMTDQIVTPLKVEITSGIFTILSWLTAS